jgi:hypothetical protein
MYNSNNNNNSSITTIHSFSLHAKELLFAAAASKELSDLDLRQGTATNESGVRRPITPSIESGRSLKLIDCRLAEGYGGGVEMDGGWPMTRPDPPNIPSVKQ